MTRFTAAFALLCGAVLTLVASGCCVFIHGDKPAHPMPSSSTTPDAPRDVKYTGNPIVVMHTSEGAVTIELFEDHAPNTVKNFVSLVDNKFYDGLTFHRFEPDFCLQGGDPRGTGEGGPGYSIKGEFDVKHAEGVISMARSQDHDSAGSQIYFALTTERTRQLDGKYAVFGRVTEGWDNVKRMRQGAKIVSATCTKRRDHPYEPAKIIPAKQ